MFSNSKIGNTIKNNTNTNRNNNMSMKYSIGRIKIHRKIGEHWPKRKGKIFNGNKQRKNNYKFNKGKDRRNLFLI